MLMSSNINKHSAYIAFMRKSTITGYYKVEIWAIIK